MSIQENNIRLENNNTNLNGIYNAINNLPTLKLQDKSVTPTMEQQTITADESYTGLSSVSVGAIQDENLVPENIKNDVEILGVKGSFAGEKYKPRYMYRDAQLFRQYTGTELDHETSMLDTTYFTSMYMMFYYCQNLTRLDLSSWNTSNVSDMSMMFYNCNALTELDVSNFDTSNVTDMSSMFEECRKISKLDVSNFDTSNVKSMSNMFKGCNALTKLDTSNWDGTNVTSMGSMFMHCQQLTELDLSNFDTSNVTNMGQTFWGCSKLTKLDIRKFDFTKLTINNNTFYQVPTDCLIIVKDDTAKEWVLKQNSKFTNVKTVAELGE